MKVGIITFHASHNYGSMLQAYALQQTVLRLGHECEIINLRTSIQKRYYLPFLLQPGKRKKAKAIIHPILAIDDVRKYWKFEKFLKDKYILSPRTYSTAEALKEDCLDYDFFISGSDQIWNTICIDFMTSYFLDFVKTGKRIAYAPSMGGVPHISIDEKFFPFIRENIKKYDAISVREEATLARIKEIMGDSDDLDISIAADPTLLLDRKDWLDFIGEKAIIDDDYILLYTPWYANWMMKPVYERAIELARQHNLKVVCTLPDATNLYGRIKGFKYYTAVGPLEFLNLMRHARYVVSASFHAVVFSILFDKPFYAYDGMKDGRISNLLKIAGLEKYAEETECLLPEFDGEEARKRVAPYINRSVLFLKNALK